MMSEIYYGPIIWTGHVYYAVIIIYRAPPHTLHVLELSYTDPHSECGVTPLFVLCTTFAIQKTRGFEI
jgi:hypothetical protein